MFNLYRLSFGVKIQVLWNAIHHFVQNAALFTTFCTEDLHICYEMYVVKHFL